MKAPSPINLHHELAQVTKVWSPRVIAQLNGQFVKVAKIHGEFVWHHHETEDELFLVVKGSFRMDFEGESVALREGECLVVPRGLRHRPVAEEECWIALFEPATTAHTGDVASELTSSIAEQTAHLNP